MPCRIELDEVEWMVVVGCTDAEQHHAQPIRLSATVQSMEPFAAARTDRLEHTVDADQLRQAMSEVIRAARVRTLERLGGLMEEALRARFPLSGLLWEIKIRKPRFGWSYVHAWRS